MKSEAQIISRYPASIIKLIGDEEYCALLASMFGNLGGSYARNLRYKTDKFGGHLPSRRLCCCLRACFADSDGLTGFLSDFLQFWWHFEWFGE